MRRDDDITIAFALSPEEAVILDCMAGSEHVSRCNVIRTALWSLADHMGIDPPLGVFDMRQTPKELPPTQRKRARVTQPNQRIRQGYGKAQPANHPWRRA